MEQIFVCLFYHLALRLLLVSLFPHSFFFSFCLLLDRGNFRIYKWAESYLLYEVFLGSLAKKKVYSRFIFILLFRSWLTFLFRFGCTLSYI
jgi:hypothetical protein